MEDIFSYFDYGFTFVLSVYLLVRMEKKIELLTTSINKLTKKQDEE